MTLFTCFAGFSALIMGIGLFGMLSYNVSQRSRETSSRTALGATPSDIAGGILSQAKAVTVFGVTLGIAVAVLTASRFSSFLFGISTYDTTTIIVVTVSLFAVTTSAALLPAARAARIDPARTLRGNRSYRAGGAVP